MKWTRLMAGIVFLLAARVPDAAALHPVFEYAQTPEQAGITYEDVRFQTVDGVSLHGWLMPFQDQEGNADPRPAPMILLVPPANMNMGDLLWHYYRLLRGTPWHVLTFDWRGFGSSQEWDINPENVVMPEFVRDLNAAIDYVKTRPEWDESHIGIFAFNMGAAVALATASQRDDLSCLALRGLYTTHEAFVENLRTAEPQATYSINPEFPDGLEPINVAAHVKTPVFLIAGGEDRITTKAMAEQVYHALSGKRELWVSKPAGFKGVDIPESVQMPEFTAKLHAFFRRYLGTGRH